MNAKKQRDTIEAANALFRAALQEIIDAAPATAEYYARDIALRALAKSQPSDSIATENR